MEELAGQQLMQVGVRDLIWEQKSNGRCTGNETLRAWKSRVAKKEGRMRGTAGSSELIRYHLVTTR